MLPSAMRRGETLVRVPDLIGMDANDATGLLREVGLRPGVFRFQWSQEYGNRNRDRPGPADWNEGRASIPRRSDDLHRAVPVSDATVRSAVLGRRAYTLRPDR
jgi:hypothetical protein